jgi:hypothetical protein
MATLTTGVMFLLFTFGYGKFYEGGPRVRRHPTKWTAIWREFNKHCLKGPRYVLLIFVLIATPVVGLCTCLWLLSFLRILAEYCYVVVTLLFVYETHW